MMCVGNVPTHITKEPHDMGKIAIATQEIIRPYTARESTNQFTAHIAAFDDGKTRQYDPDADENLGTVLSQLRRAAKDYTPTEGPAGRSIEVNWLDKDGKVLPGSKGTPEGAVAFTFRLRSLIVKTSKTDLTSSAELASVEAPSTVAAKRGSK